jgi:hypothetical protein
MLFPRLLALAILVHEGVWICRGGDTYLSDCFLPAFGLSLSRSQMRAAHAALIGCCLGILLRPQLWLFYPALLIALTVVIASYSLRLSNHLVVAWFMTLLLCLDLLFQVPGRRGLAPTPFLFGGIQTLMLLTYAIAFFHKLNAEYLSPRQSCGAALARAHLDNRAIRHPRLVRGYGLLAIYTTLLLEGGLPLLLFLPATRALGLCLALLLHLPFGLICQVYFPTLMYAGLAAFIPPDDWPGIAAAARAAPLPLLLGLLLGAVVGRGFSVSSVMRYRRPFQALQVGFGLYTAAALAAGLLLFCQGALPALGGDGISAAGRVALVLVGVAYLLNGLAPYLGLKLEYSLAMFSNLRPEPWCHLLFPGCWRPFNRAHTVRVERIEGLPARGKHRGGWYADLVLTCLLQADRWQFSPYFFHEGLRLICRCADPIPVIRVVYVEDGVGYAVSDYAREIAARPPHYRRATLFPYKLPLDPRLSHCA